jgi:hypothetical protein
VGSPSIPSRAATIKPYVVAVTASVALFALATGASGTAGPGGWDHLGHGATATTPSLNGTVSALNADAPGVLYVGGAFTDAGGDPNADYIAAWTGEAWKALGASRLNGGVDAIAYRNGKVYAGGVFTNAGGNPNADFLAVWDGTRWGTVCNASGSAITGTVLALQIVGSTLYVGGAFQNGAGIPSADYLLACDLDTGAARSTVATDGDFSGAVYALTADSRGVLYAGGGFSNLDRIAAADDVAYLDGAGWHAMGSGTGPSGGAVDSFVRSLGARGTDVFVGTDSVNVAGIPQADHVARWNGSAWSALGSGPSGTDGWFPASAFIYAITTTPSRVVVAGSFQNAGGDARADGIASFDGTSWSSVGSNGAGDGPLNATTNALAVFAGRLYAGGNFSNAGGDPLARSVASYSLDAAPAGPPPPTATTTGTVLVNGSAFTAGTIPYGATVDVTNGTVSLKTDTGSVQAYGAGVSARFVLARGTDNKKPVVVLRLTGGAFRGCAKRSTSGAASGSPPTKTIRQLWGKAKGRFRTSARFASATVRGTVWLTQDRCDGTLVQVKQGVVQVSDFVKRKTVAVRSGQSYLAKH